MRKKPNLLHILKTWKYMTVPEQKFWGMLLMNETLWYKTKQPSWGKPLRCCCMTWHVGVGGFAQVVWGNWGTQSRVSNTLRKVLRNAKILYSNFFIWWLTWCKWVFSGSFMCVTSLLWIKSYFFSWLSSEYEDPELYSRCHVQQEWLFKSFYIHNAYMHNTLQFISHTANSFPSMEVVMQIHILSSHWTRCQPDLGNINATSKWKISVPTAKLLVIYIKKKDLMKNMSSSVHSLPNRCTPMLLATIWFINGLKKGKLLYRVTCSMRNSLKDCLMETIKMMDRTTVFLPSS